MTKWQMPARLVRYLKDRLWERRCDICGMPVVPAHKEARLCESCAAQLKPIEKGAYCPWCGQILPKKDERRFFCGACILTPPPWQEIHLLGAYEGMLRDMLTALKFQGALFMGHLLGTLLACSMPASFADASYLLVPIPLSTQRLRERGFNQALEIARPIAKKFAFELSPDALVKCRHTSPQSEQPRNFRWKNVRGAFQANQKLIAGRNVILCDDIMTTGSTMKEAARIVQQAGAASISVLVAARTPPPEMAGWRKTGWRQ